jgi:transcription elongation factor GreA
MKGRISDYSPFGKALMGREKNDVVSIEVPAGVLKFKIKDIQK